jgi:hypothetical protein
MVMRLRHVQARRQRGDKQQILFCMQIRQSRNLVGPAKAQAREPL